MTDDKRETNVTDAEVEAGVRAYLAVPTWNPGVESEEESWSRQVKTILAAVVPLLRERLGREARQTQIAHGNITGWSVQGDAVNDPFTPLPKGCLAGCIEKDYGLSHRHDCPNNPINWNLRSPKPSHGGDLLRTIRRCLNDAAATELDYENAILASDWLRAHDDALRERLAQEVEAMPISHPFHEKGRRIPFVIWHKASEVRDDAARIVRGGGRPIYTELDRAYDAATLDASKADPNWGKR